MQNQNLLTCPNHFHSKLLIVTQSFLLIVLGNLKTNYYGHFYCLKFLYKYIYALLYIISDIV